MKPTGEGSNSATAASPWDGAVGLPSLRSGRTVRADVSTIFFCLFDAHHALEKSNANPIDRYSHAEIVFDFIHVVIRYGSILEAFLAVISDCCCENIAYVLHYEREAYRQLSSHCVFVQPVSCFNTFSSFCSSRGTDAVTLSF